jgi:kumamolisin
MLANSLHHLPPGSVAKRRTNPNRWLELTVGVRRRKQLPDLSALDAKPGRAQIHDPRSAAQ